MGVGPIQLAVFRCPLIADGLYDLEVLCPTLPVTISKEMASLAAPQPFAASNSVTTTSAITNATNMPPESSAAPVAFFFDLERAAVALHKPNPSPE